MSEADDGPVRVPTPDEVRARNSSLRPNERNLLRRIVARLEKSGGGRVSVIYNYLDDDLRLDLVRRELKAGGWEMDWDQDYIQVRAAGD